MSFVLEVAHTSMEFYRIKDCPGLYNLRAGNVDRMRSFFQICFDRCSLKRGKVMGKRMRGLPAISFFKTPLALSVRNEGDKLQHL